MLEITGKNGATTILSKRTQNILETSGTIRFLSDCDESVGMCAKRAFARAHILRMKRRKFLAVSTTAAASLALPRFAFSKSSNSGRSVSMDAAWYQKNRRYAALPMCKVAYVEHGRGPAALFLHGLTLNGYQWRGALEHLGDHRRCIAPDFMSMGFTETLEQQNITPDTQAAMLAALLDDLHIKKVDLVANDSGGMVAQVFVAQYSERVRSLLLTNCDVDENNPPKNFVPAVELAKKGLFAENFLLPQLKDKQLARTGKGMIGSVYTYPERLTDETIEIYFGQVCQSKLRMSQMDQYTVSLGANELVDLREKLRAWKGPARMVWALKDEFFPVQWADWLDKNLTNSKGVRRLEEAKLFFPEEMPDVIAEEAVSLWAKART